MTTGATIGLKNTQSRRDLPIHPALLPLLRAMRKEARDKTGRVFNMLDDQVRNTEWNGRALRKSLQLVGVTDHDLLEGSDAVLPFDDRSWRTTFATWCTKAGYDSTWVDAWLGHKATTTATRHYVKDTPRFDDVTLKPVRAGVTPPFPPLPESLLDGGEVKAGEKATTETLSWNSRASVIRGGDYCLNIAENGLN